MLNRKSERIHNHLGKKAVLPFSLNADLKRGFTVAQVWGADGLRFRDYAG